jgi:hypothetical protein
MSGTPEPHMSKSLKCCENFFGSIEASVPDPYVFRPPGLITSTDKNFLAKNYILIIKHIFKILKLLNFIY